MPVRPVAQRLPLTAALLALTLNACGGGGGESGPAGGSTPPATRSLGGAVSGLVGTGLVLVNGASNQVVVTHDGSFTFPARLAEGSAYAVTVLVQPSGPAQTCAVAAGSGVVGAADVWSVAVTCSPPAARTVRVSVSNLAGSGLTVSRTGAGGLQLNPPGGTFAWGAPHAYGEAYLVTIDVQPTAPTQTCTFADASYSGIIGEADVVVPIVCDTPTYALGGTVSGLVGTGLALSAGGLPLPVANGPFSFATRLQEGAPYTVTVASQPTGPAQTCAVTGGTGVVGPADVQSVAVTCAPPPARAVSVSVTNLVGSGLVVSLAGAGTLPVSAPGGTVSWGPTHAYGAAYLVSIVAQPAAPAQACRFTDASNAGTVGDSDVSVTVVCDTPAYTLGGSVTGLEGAGLVLASNGVELAIPANGTFTFPGALPDGSAYDVAVLGEPVSPTQRCSVTGGSGYVKGTNVTGVTVTCTTSAYVVGGTVTGLAGSGLVLRNNAADLVAVVDAKFSFDVKYFPGTPYSVTVAVQPSKPTQICTVANGTGTVTSGNVTNVAVNCADASYAVGGVVKGLAGSGLQLSLSKNQLLDIGENGAFTFPMPLANGSDWAVLVATPPRGPRQTCVVSNGEGRISGAPVADVQVACATDRYAISGTVSGLVGAGLVIENSGGDPLSVVANGPFTFAGRVEDLAPYAVTVRTQPAGPAQICTVAGGVGAMNGADVTGVAITCATATFTVGGTVTGLVGTGLGLGLNAGALALQIGGNGPFTFLGIADGSGYDVTVRALPSNPTQTCAVAGGKGTLAGANVTSVQVTCTSKVEASAVALGSTQAEIRWAPFGVVPTGYEVYLYAPTAVPPEQLIATLPAGAGSFVHRGRAPSQLYSYRVAALRAGPALSSPWVSMRTLPQATFPAAPTGLGAVVTRTREGDEVTLHWDRHGGATRYDVYRTSYPDLIGTTQGRVFVGTTDGATTMMTDPTGPAAGIHHYQLYAVRASPAATSPVAALPVTVTRGPLLSLERPWLDVFRSAYDRTVLHLHWYGTPGTTTQHVYAAADSSKITPAEGSLAPPLDLGDTNVPIVETSPGKFLMDVPYGLFAVGTTMWFKVASAGGGVESYSEDAVGVTIRAPAPAGVGSLAASARNPTAIRLTWGQAAGASTYNVYRLPDPTTPIAPQYWVGATGALDYTDTWLAQDTAYVYRVTAVAAGGAESPPSDYAAARTLVSGAPIMIVPAVQPGPIPYSATLAWIPRNGGATFRIYGGDALAVPDVDMTNLVATTSAFVKTVYVSTDTLLLSLATMSMAPPVGGYAVAEVYPDGTTSALSNVSAVIYFF